METKIEKLEDGSYNYVKKVVTLEEENWSEEQFNDNFMKLKARVEELKDQIAPIKDELVKAEEMEQEFLKHISDEPVLELDESIEEEVLEVEQEEE